MKIRPIAFYLPQYHPVPENDQWWGKGFTEWTNVARAKPLFRDHYQPQVPADLGFYDLRLPETRAAQAEYAARYGIYGFCYYYYWFSGRKILERPIEEVLKTGEPQFPFLICWANENWTRRWDGLEADVLLKQEYTEADDEALIKTLLPFFRDPRYIRVDGKPVFVLYKHFLMPDPARSAGKWREVARQHGLELYLCHMVFGYAPEHRFLVDGFDAVIDFEPFGVRRSEETPAKGGLLARIARRLKNDPLRKLPVKEYRSMFEALASTKNFEFKIYPSVVPGWDNSPRRPKAPLLILKDSSPEYFGEWLGKVVDDFQPYSDEENLVFINAWNEWAEGNHLEPCMRWGTQYLEAVKKVMESKFRL